MILVRRTKTDVTFIDTETDLKVTLEGENTSPMEAMDFLARCLVTVSMTIGIPNDIVMNYFSSVIESAALHTGEPIWTWEDIQKIINGEDLSE